MAFSGSTDFSYTRDQVIKAALRKCRAYDTDGGAPEAYQVTDAAEALNLILKEFQTQGGVLWVQQDVEVRLAKGKRTYSIGATGDVVATRPLRIFNPFLRDTSASTDVPLQVYSRSDYQGLTNKFTTGTPTCVYYSRQISDGVLSVWPVPDASTDKIIFTSETQLQDFDSSGDTAHMPSFAYRYFVWALAAEIGSEYGVGLDELSYFEQKAMALKDDLLDFQEEEDGFQMVPDWTVYG